LLLDTLQANAPSRIVNVSSAGHAAYFDGFVTIDFDDLHFDMRE